MVREDIKKEFMAIKTGEELNEFREKYASVDFKFDLEMKMHLNEIALSYASKERLENPDTHYEVFK